MLYRGRPVSTNIIDRRSDPYNGMTLEEILLEQERRINEAIAIREAINKGYVEPHPRIPRPDPQAPIPHPRPMK